ncbi:hypothetical protein [Comamonas sp. GB3 AK4-5]|uniref:hypothetical protein n=1 Tax=Comamonas sp. GB3 AK4-5 TaxID=3231487 RepID=UPI00351F271D
MRRRWLIHTHFAKRQKIKFVFADSTKAFDILANAAALVLARMAALMCANRFTSLLNHAPAALAGVMVCAHTSTTIKTITG